MKKCISAILVMSLLLLSACSSGFGGKKSNVEQKTLEEAHEEMEREKEEESEELSYNDGYKEGYKEGSDERENERSYEEGYREGYRDGYEDDYYEDDYDNHSDGYMFPSDRRYITERDLRVCTKEDVALIRNEIYARHGYIFKTEPYKSYFASMDWYYPNVNFSEDMFNEIERANKSFLVEYEKKMGWR